MFLRCHGTELPSEVMLVPLGASPLMKRPVRMRILCFANFFLVSYAHSNHTSSHTLSNTDSYKPLIPLSRSLLLLSTTFRLPDLFVLR